MSVQHTQDYLTCFLVEQVRVLNRETGVPAQAHQIGNGEWIVFFNATKYVWGLQDWEHLKQEHV